MRFLKNLFRRDSSDNSFPSTSYKVHKFNITKHCVDDMNDRKITKGEIYVNLTTKPIHITQIKLDKMGRPSYRRSSKNKITTAINPNNNNVVSVNRLHTKKYNKIMRGKKMTKISESSREFIEKYALKELGFEDINDDNIEEIVDYIIDNFEIPLAQAKEAGEDIDENLLKKAKNTITEITSDPNW